METIIKSSRLIIFLNIMFLTSCASWSQKPIDYRYVDNGEVNIKKISDARNHDQTILNFPIYGALSKSIYLDEKTSTLLTNMVSFCNTNGALFRPNDWEKIVNLKVLNDRKTEHSQLKLEIEVFTKKITHHKSTAVIVFRGTDFEEEEDWSSNFRWFNRLFSTKLDQYDEVRILTPLLVAEIEQLDDTVTRFVSTGHSLGGGLAQLAGYSSHKINTVFAFDSSPVTGFYDVEGGLRRFNSQNLKIYRIYEHGEALAYIRLAMKGIYPVSENNPDIIQVRFNLTTDENLISQHSIKALACKLHKAI